MLTSILLNNPVQYAERAISVIEEQLRTAKSPARIAKLQCRLKQWKTALQILSESDGKETDTTKEK